ncbi:glycosyltransferase [Kocuria flava]|uniref:glycosyltransferase n=1 Tax=Kocuria flava TaxID=446860 RepID=UPI000C7DD0C0|nr:glycosyltransferase [Kocuria flava]
MRVLHIATVVTPDGAYGGPVRVAVNLCSELAEHGWDARIAAGTWGFAAPPHSQDGVPLFLFHAWRMLPGRGFAATFSPKLLRSFGRLISRADLVHVHLGRDLVTLPFAALCRAARVPYVVQCHGMVVANDHPLTGILDRLVTQGVLRSARRVFWLTEREQVAMAELFGPDLAWQHLRNGVSLPEKQALPALSDEVLYMARLHPRKRPELLVDAAVTVGRRLGNMRLAVVGPDEGSAEDVQRAAASAGAGTTISVEGPLAPERTSARFLQAGLYVLPSIDEPFPMSALEAMSLGLPVIITDSCGLAPFVRGSDAGIVVDASVEQLEQALESLLRDPSRRSELGANARRLVEREFALGAVVDELEGIYRSILSGS